MKLVITFFIFLFTVSATYSQVGLEWIKNSNGTSNISDAARSSAIDPSGNIIVTGSINNSGTQNDIYTVKYSPSGNVIWSAVYNSPYNRNDAGYYIVCDGIGNVYVAGISDSAQNTPNYITIKYDPSGTLLWVNRYNGHGPGTSGDILKGIVLDNAANVYVTGTSIGLGTSYDIATVKYNTNGALQWLVRFDSAQDEAGSIAVDASSNVYIGGSSSMSGSLSLLLLKYNASGTLQWFKNVPSAPIIDVNSVRLAVDNSNNVFVAGTVLLQSNIMTRKYSANGDLLWENIYNGPANLSDGCVSMIKDPSENIIISGYTYSAVSQVDALILNYSNAGSLNWSRTFNGLGNSADWPNNLTSDNTGNIYITGRSVGYSNTNQVFSNKYDPAGILQWNRIYDGLAEGNDAGNSVQCDAGGNVYVSASTAEINSNTDFTVLKYSPGSIHDIVSGPFVNLPYQYLTNSTYQINARFYNNGNSSEQNFPVRWYINSTLINTEFLSLASGETDTLTRSWTPTAAGTYELKYIVSLPNDINYSNDTVKTTVQVVNPPQFVSSISICRNNLNKPTSDITTIYDTIFINIPNSISVLDVNVKIDTVLHTWDADLEFKLKHLSVTDSIIMNRGGSGDNFIHTYLNDSALIPIANGTAPLTGNFKPDKPLSKLNGLALNGAWVLMITDMGGGDTGLLKAWCLDIVYDYVTGTGTAQNIPAKFTLSQNYPNPFNPVTSISFDVPLNTFVELKIFDILGREIKSLVNNEYQPGSYKVDFDASVLPSGVYIYRLTAGDFTESKKMVLIK